jgi:ribosomal protein S18 acetylase RimI-like enzyme
LITKEWSDWRNGDFWWVQSVYVVPEHRGRGVYRQLYRHVQRLAARHRSVVGFRLYVDHDNARARRVYRSLGMKETRYVVFEQLKPGIRFFTPARKRRR